ncbi:MAG: ABC transporter ATP-binding protein [Synergistaceae bacterium]|jgi:peptide/nickel transport system ATP-binding protein|nr:ABC transporter ATP-binding protein [Synergistaceae bacterium]
MKDILLDIKDLEVTYDTEDGIVRAVNGVSLQVVRGKTLGLLGETGAGKTTAAKCVLRILPERTGNIRRGNIIYDGADLLKLRIGEMQAIRGEKISMIFQDPMSSLNPVLRVGEQIAEALELHSGKNREARNSAAIQKRVDEILEMVGIPADRGGEYPHQFSGGMKQRVVIAMALVCEPELVIADEPTTALDVTIQAQVLEMMEKLKREFSTSMLLITHDLGVVAETCDDVAVMYAGEIIEHGSVEDIFDPSAPHHPYTAGLFGSIPRLDDELPRLKPIGGLMPDPTDLPAGCKFSPRCSHRTEHCDVPPPNALCGGDHTVRCVMCAKEEM